MSQPTHNLTQCLRAGKALLAGLLLWLGQAAAGASQSVTLTWVPSTDAAVAGFKIYYGPTSHNYTNSIALGLVTNVTVTGLAEGATYYFAATTYDANANESDYSNEAIYEIPALVIPPPVTNPPVVIVTNEPPVITNLPPVEVTNSFPVVTNLPPVITNTPPVEVTNSLPVVTNTPPSITNAPPVEITNSLPTVTNTPASGNQAPTLNALATLTINQNVAGQTIGLSGITSGATNEIQTLKLTVTSSNPNLIKPAINYVSPKTTGTLTFKPASNQSGSALITVTVNDGGASNNLCVRTFQVNVVATTSAKANLKRPMFNRFPTNSVSLVGRTVTLSAAATGQAPLKYQWNFNGQAIAGATTANLSLKNVQAAQSGVYTLTVANSLGTTNSSAAVTVLPTAAATLGTATRTGNGAFSFSVTGVPGFKYVIQTTSDLSHWTAVQTNTSPFTFVDNSPAASQRFYRSYYDSAL